MAFTWTFVLVGEMALLGSLAAFFFYAVTPADRWITDPHFVELPVARVPAEDCGCFSGAVRFVRLEHGCIRVAGRQVSLAELRDLLHGADRVYLRAAADSPWEHVRWILAIAREAGAYSIRVAVRTPEGVTRHLAAMPATTTDDPGHLVDAPPPPDWRSRFGRDRPVAGRLHAAPDAPFQTVVTQLASFHWHGVERVVIDPDPPPADVIHTRKLPPP